MEPKKIKIGLNVKCKALKWSDSANPFEILGNCQLDLLQNDKKEKILRFHKRKIKSLFKQIKFILILLLNFRRRQKF